MSSSVFMEQPKRSESTCTIPFTVKSDGVSTLTARLLTFGHCPGTVVNKHILTIYYVMSDGSKWYYSVDVTDQLHKAGADPQHIVIVLDNIPVPDPINPGGGFNIDVGGWNNVYVDLPIM